MHLQKLFIIEASQEDNALNITNLISIVIQYNYFPKVLINLVNVTINYR